MRLLLACAILSLGGCPKQSGSSKALQVTDQAVEAFVRERLPLRKWLSCSRMTDLVLEEVNIVVDIDEIGHPTRLYLQPEARVEEPELVCVALELRHPPDFPAPGIAHVVVLPLASVIPESSTL